MLKYTNGARRAITGPGLAQLRRRMSASARAVLAADIVDGRVILQGLTIKAIAALAGVNVGYVDSALRLTPEQREQVKRGERPLVRPRPHTSNHSINWDEIDDEVLVEAVRRIGVERALDAAIAAERTTI